jgi:hypothetical protein
MGEAHERDIGNLTCSEFLVEGKNRREAAHVFGLIRETISKTCRFSVPPGYVHSKPEPSWLRSKSHRQRVPCAAEKNHRTFPFA